MQLKEGEKIPSLAGQAWQKMSKKEKEPYLQKVEEDRKRYEREMEAYKKNVCSLLLWHYLLMKFCWPLHIISQAM